MVTAAHRGRPSRAGEPPPILLLPLGIPTYSLRHGFYVWKPGTKPVTQLYPDWDIFWVRSGEASWDFADGRRLSAGPDEFIILPPSTPAVVSQSRPSMSFWFCHFAFRQAPTHIAEEWQPDFSGASAPVEVPMRFSRREAPEVWKAYRDLSRLDASASAAGPHSWRLERALIALIAHLAAFARSRRRAAGPTAPVVTPRRDPRIASLCARIDGDPIHTWRVSTLAASVELSPGRLNALFRDATGMSLKHFIVTARLRHSLLLLTQDADGRMPSVKEVSDACGFSSQHFFSRQFSALFGLGPLAYRNGGTFG